MLIVTKIFSQPQDFHKFFYPYPKGIVKPWYKLVLTDTCCFASTLEGPVTVFHILIISVSNLHIFTLLDIRQRQFGKPRKIHFFNSCPIRSNCNWCITTLNWRLVLVVAHTLTLWPLALLSLVPSNTWYPFQNKQHYGVPLFR